jgi:hypothetical protein
LIVFQAVALAGVLADASRSARGAFSFRLAAAVVIAASMSSMSLSVAFLSRIGGAGAWPLM